MKHLSLVVLLAVLANAQDSLPTRVVALHYPCLALKAKIEGSVTLRCTLANDGTPSKVQIVRGHPLFLATAIENAKKWRFQPVGRAGISPRTFDLSYRFRIRGQRKLYDDDVEVVFELPAVVVVSAGYEPDAPCKIPPRL